MVLRVIHEKQPEGYTESEEQKLRDCISSAPGVIAVTEIKRHSKGGYSVTVTSNDNLVDAMLEYIPASGYQTVL